MKVSCHAYQVGVTRRLVFVVLQLFAEFHRISSQAADHRLKEEWRNLQELIVAITREKSSHQQHLQQLVDDHDAD